MCVIFCDLRCAKPGQDFVSFKIHQCVRLSTRGSRYINEHRCLHPSLFLEAFAILYSNESNTTTVSTASTQKQKQTQRIPVLDGGSNILVHLDVHPNALLVPRVEPLQAGMLVLCRLQHAHLKAISRTKAYLNAVFGAASSETTRIFLQLFFGCGEFDLEMWGI